MGTPLPRPILASVSAALARAFSHSELDHLFDILDARAPLSTGSNKETKCRAYLEAAGQFGDPLPLLGGLLHELIDVVTPQRSAYLQDGEELPWHRDLGTALAALEKAGLRYADGKVFRAGAKPQPPSRALREVLRAGDYSSVEEEFRKAEANIESDPREAVRAACALLESLFKHYIEDTPVLALPAKQDLGSLWGIVRKQFNLDASAVEDKDLQKIITGLGSIADGIGALRTHASTAHGRGRKTYTVEPRHARLAVNSSHTLATFILETWTKQSAMRGATARSR